MRTLSKICGVSFLVFLGCEFSYAQANNSNNSNQVQTQQTPSQNTPSVLSPSSKLPLDGAYIPQDAGHRRVVPPAQMRAADIMWKERIWRIINTKEKMNQDLYYPVQANLNRISLLELIKKAVKTGEISAYQYNVRDPDDYSVRFEPKEFLNQLVDSIKISGANTENGKDTVIAIPASPERVTGYEIKEDWHFEKQRSVLDPRILWICPITQAVDPNTGQTDPSRVKFLFWVNFDQLRPFLAHQTVFNGENDAEWRTFDDVFYKRQFSSYIVEQSNVFNRTIDKYLKGVDALLESDKIHDKIEGVESDMWQY